MSAAGILSFHPRKVITTGEGGALLTDEPKIADFARAYSDHGFNFKAEQIGPGLNLRLPEISCALGLEQLGRIDKIIQDRQQTGDRYRAAFADQPDLKTPNEPEGNSWNHQTFAVVCRTKGVRDRLIQALKSENIESNVPAASVSAMPYYRKKYGIPDTRVPVSRSLAENALALPYHEQLSDSDIQRIVKVIVRSLDG